MGLENMRRWPMYIVFAGCILLLLSLVNSWSLETELRNQMSDMNIQILTCSKQLASCTEESINLLEQRDDYSYKLKDTNKEKVDLLETINQFKKKVALAETQANRTLYDVELCKTELQSSKNLQLTKSATLETIRFEKNKLTTQLAERKQKIEELEKEIERLKTALTTKAASNPIVVSKVTPAVQPPKMSPALNIHNPLDETIIDPKDDNDAKEDIEDTNVANDGNDLDPQLQ